MDAADRQNFEALNTKRADYAKARESYLDLVSKGDRAAAAGVLKKTLLPAYYAYSEANNALLDFNRKGGEAESTAIVANTRRTLVAIVSVSVTALLIGVAVSFLIIRGLNRILREIATVLGSNS